jgi:hypothetical protein
LSIILGAAAGLLQMALRSPNLNDNSGSNERSDSDDNLGACTGGEYTRIQTDFLEGSRTSGALATTATGLGSDEHEGSGDSRSMEGHAAVSYSVSNEGFVGHRKIFDLCEWSIRRIRK